MGWAMSVFLRSDHEVIESMLRSILVDVVGVQSDEVHQKVNVVKLIEFVSLEVGNATKKAQTLTRIAGRLGEVIFEQAQSMKEMMGREEGSNDDKFGMLNLGEAKEVSQNC
eukprot:c20520_g1_i6.p4 GENE.c20520_g1_i6~~c20520_g1_i6.p4  ORF type:complete len:111 (-),score=31.05 c20520_g1_i6:175-507(-)